MHLFMSWESMKLPIAYKILYAEVKKKRLILYSVIIYYCLIIDISNYLSGIIYYCPIFRTFDYLSVIVILYFLCQHS